MMGYLKGTQTLGLTLKDLGKGVSWWVDAAFAVHPGTRGHTCGTMSLGKDSIINKSAKQKLNTSSSTEVELVGTYEMMLKILWTNYFLQEQGYGSSPALVYQDNMSAMLLEKNGKLSSTKWTKYVCICYYLIHDRWKQGEIDIQHCSTDEMVVDCLTKPLRGKKFIKFRAIILGIRKDNVPSTT